MANKQFNLNDLNEYRKSWKSVNIDCLEKQDAQAYLKKKYAVDMYIDGHNLKDIESVINIKFTKYVGMIKRCLKLDDQGIMYGYTGLIPYKHIKQYGRKQSVIDNSPNYSGALCQLFNNYPYLKEFIDDAFLQRDKNNIEKNIKPNIIFNKFLDKCREIGIKENEYPFNTQNLGKRSFYEYIRELEMQKSNEAIKRYDRNALQKYKSTGIGNKTDYDRQRPYSKVQIDGHEVDLEASIKLEDESGYYYSVPIKRFWLLTVIDVATRTILGYHMTIKEQYDRFDVLFCIKNAIEPRERMNFTIPGLQYPDGGGYPSFDIEATKWAVFDEIELDNALAHHSQIAVSKITDYLNAAMSFGPVSTPERRGIIERFFGTLEEKGYHRIPSTTGSNILDARRRHCEENAVKFEISFQEIVELTEVLIAEYNLSSHSSLKNFSPVEIMKQRIERGMCPSKLEEDKQNDFTLLDYTITRQVRGSIETGRRPYIQYEDVEYRSDELSLNCSLIGKTINVLINPEDLRTMKAFQKDGSELGTLYAVGKWGNTPHTLKQRRAINKYIRENHINIRPFDDPVAIYLEYLNYKSKNNKAARNKLGDLKNTLKNDNSLCNYNDNVIPITQKENDKSALSNKNHLLSQDELIANFNTDVVSSIYKNTKER